MGFKKGEITMDNETFLFDVITMSNKITGNVLYIVIGVIEQS